MRNLPTKRSIEQETIIRAVKDFYGDYYKGQKLQRSIINTALWIMGRRSGVSLNEEEKDAAWYVLSNIADKRYCRSLMEVSNLEFWPVF